MATSNDSLAPFSGNPIVPGLNHSFQKHKLGTFFNLAADEIVRRLPMREMELSFPPNSLHKQRPRSFVRAARQECRNQWPILTDKSNWGFVLTHCDFHHKVPQEMGGLNNADNLIFIDLDVHKEIHRCIDTIFSLATRIIKDRYPALKDEEKILTRWVKEERDFGPLISDLSVVPNLRFDDKEKPLITIPYPEGRVFIPQFLSTYLPLLARSSSKCLANLSLKLT